MTISSYLVFLGALGAIAGLIMLLTWNLLAGSILVGVALLPPSITVYRLRRDVKRLAAQMITLVAQAARQIDEDSLAEDLARSGALARVEDLGFSADVVLTWGTLYTNVILYGPRFNADLVRQIAVLASNAMKRHANVKRNRGNWAISYPNRIDDLDSHPDDKATVAFHNALVDLANKVAMELKDIMGLQHLDNPAKITADKVIFVVPMAFPSLQPCLAEMKNNGVQQVHFVFFLEPPPDCLKDLRELYPDMGFMNLIRRETATQALVKRLHDEELGLRE